MGAITYTNRARTNVIDKNAILANGNRAAADYDNDGNKDLACNAFLSVQWNTTAPSAGAKVAELYILPGDDAGPDVYPNGGDGTVGNDFDPQPVHLVGVFTAVDPSITVDDELALGGLALHHSGNRFVIKNVSAQEFDLTWQLDIVPYTLTVAA